jgi:hypothetical protein
VRSSVGAVALPTVRVRQHKPNTQPAAHPPRAIHSPRPPRTVTLCSAGQPACLSLRAPGDPACFRFGALSHASPSQERGLNYQQPGAVPRDVTVPGQQHSPVRSSSTAAESERSRQSAAPGPEHCTEQQPCRRYPRRTRERRDTANRWPHRGSNTIKGAPRDSEYKQQAQRY